MKNSITINLNFSSVNKIFKKVENLIYNLADRWSEEYMYEDIKEYGKVIEKELIKINPEFEGKIKMTKRPFGFKFNVSNYTLKDGRTVECEIRMNVGGWKTYNMKLVEAA